jgi:hypothetical protein
MAMRAKRTTLATLALGLVLFALWNGSRHGPAPRVETVATGRTDARVELDSAESPAGETPRVDRPRESQRTPLAPSSEAPAFPSSELAGRVQHADGRPAAGIEVEMRAQGASDRSRPLASATSAADGSFRVTCLGRGPFSVRAHRSDRRGTRFETFFAEERGPARELRLTLPPLATLSGRVLDERGEPIPRFRIELDGPGLRLRLPVSADDGTFQVEELAEGRWRLVVEAYDHVAAEPVTVELPTKPLTLVLARECRLQGRVLGLDGEPCEGVHVTAPGFARDTTDRRGAFTVHGPAGEVGLHATSAAASGELVLTAEPGEVRTGLVLALQPAPPLPPRDETSRRVELPTGEAVEIPPRQAPAPMQVSGRITKGGNTATLRSVSFSDSEGCSGQARLEDAGFELELPHAGEFVLEAQLDTCQLDTCQWRHELVVASLARTRGHAQRYDLDVPVGWVEGLAREGSNGLAGATVRAWGRNGGAETKTDETGHFGFEVPAGTFTLTLQKGSQRGSAYDLRVVAGQRRSGIELVHEAVSPEDPERGRTFLVRVRSGSEKPVDLEAIDTSGRPFGFLRASAPSDAAPDAADRPSTWFKKLRLEPGEYQLRVWTKAGSTLHPVTLRAGSGTLTWELELP